MSCIDKRTRKKAPKSRLGCSRCKDRRIKCDETAPECQNCVRLGYQCPGFQQIWRWSTKYERTQETSLIETPGHQVTGFGSVSSADQPGEGEHCSRVNNERYIVNASNDSHDLLDDLAFDPNFAWLPRSPTPLQSTILDSGIIRGTTDTWSTTSVSQSSGFPETQHTVNYTESPEILSAPTHLPTVLVEHWFRRVCPMWSTFDSETSYNRQLVWESWGTSKVVFYTIQAMSAACLSVSTPQFQHIELSLRSQAVAAVDEALLLIRNSQSPTVTSDVVYALFTLGNSWDRTTSTVSYYPWLESARELLSIWATHLSCLDAMLHVYFHQALNYWEMLLAAVGRGSVPLRLESKRRQYHVRLCQGLQITDFDRNPAPSAALPDETGRTPAGTRPNSWSGISNEVIDIFSQVLALCFNASRYSKGARSSAASNASEVLCDLAIAHDLKRKLLAMNIETFVLMDENQGYSVQTGDDNTPVGHLLQTAEAYRQAALLQLHLAFSDLTMLSREAHPSFSRIMPGSEAKGIAEDQQTRKEYTVALALDLVAILDQIPPYSGSRSIHLMLYLSAATGLFDPFFGTGSIPNASEEIQGLDVSSDLACGFLVPETDLSQCGIRNVPALNFDHPTPVLDDTADTSMPRLTLEVFKSRELVLTRLSSLQQTLPHRRVEETLQFVRQIWKQYDNQDSDYCSIAHWLDFLAENGQVVSLW